MDITTLNALTLTFKSLHRESYNAVVNSMQAPIQDLKLMPLVFQRIKLLYELTPENTPSIISLMYSLFAPFKLLPAISDVRTKNGLRRAVLKEMGWQSKTMLNYWQPIAVVYYKNAKFADKINGQANEILSYILSLSDKVAD
ncbi:hypothetical protein ADIARSV_0145 [Arcticibacter svalbardensis MN12-7]|uniref:Uncharacterized protein n=1 Tax=Arcticibacter svalbardensis MN12-7 TaxID=1150600 RepID=R9GY46_9SPHI|nr:hypothetical protein [Arcticibacter svalbardensis]EOR96722.1 hypothetical protein ADIARSV_0145 [Arcticibacter svalbardensis MN12-7]